MRFILIYRDIAGVTRSVNFDSESIDSALVGLRERGIDDTNWGAPEDTPDRNAWPQILIDESMTAYALEETEDGRFIVQGANK